MKGQMKQTLKASLEKTSNSKYKFDPINTGLDFEKINKINEKIEFYKDECIIPTTYDIHSAVQLLPERVIDTTDRDQVLAGKKFNFDPDGFKKGRPLEKGIFYLDPYITCSWCNEMSFVNVIALRKQMLYVPYDVGANIPPEALPPCAKCNKSDFFVIGPHDFSKIIAARDKEAKDKIIRETAAGIVIKRAYRSYLQRMYGSAVTKAILVRRKLEYKAAKTINALCRGRLGRRKAKTSRLLLIVEDSHPVLIDYATKIFPGQIKTFWYTNPDHISLVFKDYIQLCDRLGFIPTRMEVEVNIKELARRILERKAFLLALIQRRWRGVQCRRIVKYFRTELVRVRQFTLSRIMKIQRSYRGHMARYLVIPKFKHDRYTDETMSKYQKAAMDKARAKEIAKMKNKVLVNYQKERGEEKFCRFTQRIELASDNNSRKMKAFSKSCYSSDVLKNSMHHLIDVEFENVNESKRVKEWEFNKKNYINSRIDEEGPEGFGLRGVKPERAFEAVYKNGFRVDEDQISSRGKSMTTYFKDEKKEIMLNIIERAQHDFKPRNLMNRLKEYNSNRLLMDEIDYQMQEQKEKKLHLIETTKTKKNNFLEKETVKKDIEKSSLELRLKQRKLKEDKNAGKATVFRPRPFKFPSSIYVDPMSFLNDDIDAILKIQATAK